MRRMEVYAAQIDRMDQGIGRIFDALRETGQWENTLILFLADNGGCAEEISAQHGSSGLSTRSRSAPAFTHDGRAVQYGNDPAVMPAAKNHLPELWHSLGQRLQHALPRVQTLGPRRRHRHAADRPLARGIAGQGALRHQPAQLPDIMATFLDVADADYPTTYAGTEIQPLEGFSMTADLHRRAGNAQGSLLGA